MVGPPAQPSPTARSSASAGARGRGARRGFAALLAGPRPQLPDALEPVLRAHRAHHPQADSALLARAYQLAEESHRGQLRKSGEPYITHPLAVTMILAQLGAETTTLVASLLHDTVEDTEVTLEQVEQGFGAEVAYLVDGVTKLEKVDFGAAAEAETFRKMLVATGDDVRVMVIKLADRLHNMRTIRHMKPASQVRIAKVTRDVLIPLAERLGIQVVKTELEDIVFATLHPQEYAATAALIAARAAEAEQEGGDPLTAFTERLRRQLREARVPAEVSIRPRHCVSVHRVRLGRGSATELAPCDFARVLVVVEENADCYAVLGELHTCWAPLPAEFKDFIAAPKFNLYQSLHTAVATPEGDVVEVLVRTPRMHRIAEYGVVALGAPVGEQPEPEEAGAQAHGPDGGPGEEWDGGDPARPGWLARLLDWQRVTPDPDTFWSRLTADLSDDREITVVTEDGRTLQLPAGADCVDAAYALGEQTGHRCIGARLNGRLAALSTRLQDGDVIAVLTESGRAEPTGPSPAWLSHARTPLARIAIERWLAEHPVPPPGRGNVTPLAPRRLREGSGKRVPASAAGGMGQEPRVLRGSEPVRVPRPIAPDAFPPRVRHAGPPGAVARLARCCTPVPPDQLIGFVVRGGSVAVHRADCPTGAQMADAGRATLAVRWESAATGAVEGLAPGYRATLQLEALGRPRLLADVTAVLSGAGVDILSAVVEPPRELRVHHTYTVSLPSAESLPELLRALLRVPGVYDVYRARREGGRRRHGARLGSLLANVSDSDRPEGDLPEGEAHGSDLPECEAWESGAGDASDGGKPDDQEAPDVGPSSGIRGGSADVVSGEGGVG